MRKALIALALVLAIGGLALSGCAPSRDCVGIEECADTTLNEESEESTSAVNFLPLVGTLISLYSLFR